MIVASKLERNEALGLGIDGIAAIRQGVDAAHLLLEELERVADRHGGFNNEAPAPISPEV